MKTVRQWDGGPETFCNVCPCRFSRPNWIKLWATRTHSEFILLQPGCWSRYVRTPSQPESSHDPTHFGPCLSQGDRREVLKCCSSKPAISLFHIFAQKDELLGAKTWSPIPAGTYCQRLSSLPEECWGDHGVKAESWLSLFWDLFCQKYLGRKGEQGEVNLVRVFTTP